MKLFVTGLAVLFVGFWMVQSPDSLAGFAHDGGIWAWDLTTQVFDGVITFLDTLFG
jgi:hypothetical protein